jgi:hypothetical protein
VYAKHHYVGLYGLQAEKLFHDKEQADHAEPAGVEEVLQVLQNAHPSPGNKIM